MPELTCPACNAPVPPGVRFCSACGASLQRPAAEGAARCAVHPDVASVDLCPRCGSFACMQCLVQRSDGVLCAACASRAPEVLLPWDQRAELGTLKAYWKTCIRLLGSPGQSLLAAPQSGSFGSSTLFILISAFVGILTTMLLEALLFGGITQLGAFKTGATEDLPLWVLPVIFVAYAVVAPFLSLLIAIVVSAVDHLTLKLVGAEPASWQTTYRAEALSMAPFLLGLIPFCGLYVYPFWHLVLKVFAYRGLHRTSWGKATAGALVPSLTIGFCFVAAYVGLILSVMGKMGK